MIFVELTDRELRIAGGVARIRYTAGVNAGANKQKYGTVENSLQLHVRGCLGEIAAAKGLNRYWHGGGTDYYNDTDLGIEQVRMTSHVKIGRLIIRPDDIEKPSIDQPWILVLQESKTKYILSGWIIGREGVKPEYIDNPNDRSPAYFVPQSALRSFPISYRN